MPARLANHLVLWAGRIEFVGDIVIVEEMSAPLIFGIYQQVLFAIEAAHLGAEDFVETEEIEISVPGAGSRWPGVVRKRPHPRRPGRLHHGPSV